LVKTWPFGTTAFFVIGAVTAGLVRLALVVPNGQVFTNDTYNKGEVPCPDHQRDQEVAEGRGNARDQEEPHHHDPVDIPLMIGARDLAFPKLNLASWYVFMTGAFFTLVSVRTTPSRPRGS
jgi:cytochrome c oxidase subunit 1